MIGVAREDHPAVKAVASQAFSPPPPPRAEALRANDAGATGEPGAAAADAMAGFWLERLFWLAEHAPRFLRFISRPVSRLAFRCSGAIRTGTLANARRILGPAST